MSDVGVHGFEIPHLKVQPTRDMVIMEIPMPPKKIGSIITPDEVRDMFAHNVIAGRIVKMGPLAFSYKDENGLQKQTANIGDWVLIRMYAGSVMTPGRHVVPCGYRYVSSFQDIIGVIPAADMSQEALDAFNPDEPDETQPELELKSQPRYSEKIGIL